MITRADLSVTIILWDFVFQLPFDVEGPFEESFGVFAPLENEEWENGKKPSTPVIGKAEWNADFQALPFFEFDCEMEQEFFRSDFIEACKEVEPTLAELNGERPMSPLVNPEMERLHRIATKSESELGSPYETLLSPRRFQPNIALELSEQSIKKEPLSPSCERNERVDRLAFAASKGERQVDNTPATWTTTEQPVLNPPVQNTRDSSSTPCRENDNTEGSYKTDVELESNTTFQLSKLAHEVKAETYRSEMLQREESANIVVKTEKEDGYGTEHASADEHEESGDEEMDSDDDFDVENHSPGTEGLVKSRKGRRGECDDLSPNPRKLLEISKELERLNKVIGGLKPIHQLPMNARTRSRKEKNKLASRYLV